MDSNKEVSIKKTKIQSFWELVRFALVALAIVIPIRLFVAQPFIVSGTSMVPTFENNQYLIVDEISYNLGTPKRNDVVVFKYPNNTKIFYIKRIIGLPGETIDVNSALDEVTITNSENPSGFKLDQSYIKNIGGIDAHTTLGNDEYFVMGDNRIASSDSRYWGSVKKDLLLGKVFVRLFPLNKIGLFPGSLN